MADIKGTPPVAPKKAPPPTLSERLNEEEVKLLDMQKQLQEQINGVGNQLFLIRRLKHPEEFVEPTLAPADTADGTI